jgi:hypothetical protein
MSEVGEEPKPLVLGVSALRSTPNRQDAVSALLRKLGNVSKPADVHTFFPFLKGCKVCGVEHPESETCPASGSKEVCGYCGRAGHLPDVCRALHNVCGICLVRGHRAGTECPDDLRLALQRFEQFADLGQLTRLRHANPFWGFYFFDQRWSMMELELQYGELILMSPAEALLLANRPFVRSVLRKQAVQRGVKREAASSASGEGGAVDPKRFKALEDRLDKLVGALESKGITASKGDKTSNRGRGKGRGRGSNRGARGRGKSTSSEPTFEDFKKFCAAQKAKGRGSQGSAPEGHTGNIRREGKDVAKGNNNSSNS